MRISVKSKIWFAVLLMVVLFSGFILFYFPLRQKENLENNYNKEIQNLANTLSLGVKIALKEQNFDGVQTAIDFIKKDSLFEFVAILQYDTIWNGSHTNFKIDKKIFNQFPENRNLTTNEKTDHYKIVKYSNFETPTMNGEIMLALNTREILHNIRELTIISIVFIFFVIAIAILCVYVLAKNILNPVIKLRNAAIGVSKGDLSQRVENNSNDEIGDLSNAFNKMVEDLSHAKKEIESSSKDLIDKQIEITSQRDQLEITLTDLKSAQEQLVQSEKLASLGELTAGIAHEIQNPLNFVNNFSEVSIELFEEMEIEMQKGDVVETNFIINELKQNLAKIQHHGKRADSIVKNMLQHSRKSSGQKELTDVNALADEFLRLSYHGIRAKDKSFNSALITNFSADVPKINIISQDIGRVLLNLYNNAFYAINQKWKLDETKSFNREIKVSTIAKDKMIIISVRDNGIGIPDKIKEKILQPFFTTKPTGEGTGLGLSLSYDIVVKVHGGKIEINTKEGEYTEFEISLPIC